MKRITQQTWGRWLAVLLSVAMVLTMLPATALAAEPDGTAKQSTAQEVQALINALPDAEAITNDNRAEVEAQLTAIDEAKLGLSDEEAEALDTTRYMAAVDAILALDDMTGADVPMLMDFPNDLPGGGTGGADNPYQISTKEQLAALSTYVSAGNQCENMHFKLMGDIDLNNEPWTPIGTRENASTYTFMGTFDGGGHTTVRNFSVLLPLEIGG